MTVAPQTKTFDVDAIRSQFPVLSRRINDKPLVYLDTGASAQTPQCVIDAMRRFYEHDYANIHRAVHELSQVATEQYENARRKIQHFINAPAPEEVIFVRGATEAVNLIANSYGRTNLKAGDEILITAMEHHANIVPWQMLCEQTGTVLRVAPFDESGTLDLDAFKSLLNEHTKIVAFTQVSNALGTINPVREMTQWAHDVGAVVLVDGAQGVPHTRVDVQEIGCDFYVFSGHKVYGPTGVGILWGRRELLDAMPPWQGGGDMIRSVSFDGTEYADLPNKFEAGTPAIASGIGLGVAVEWLSNDVGLDAVAKHEAELVEYASAKLAAIDGLRLIGTSPNRAGLVSFVLSDIHSTDAGMILNEQGIAIRAGHHCAEPSVRAFGVPATIRASFGVYNTKSEIDALVAGVNKVREIFGA